MASRIYAINVTVPAGTPIANPQVTPWVTEDKVITSIEVSIPTGHSGRTGIRIMKGDIQLVPWGVNTWIVGSGIDHDFSVGQYLPTGDVTIQAYNIGTFPHTFYLRMTLEIYRPPPLGAVPVSRTALSAEAVTSPSDPLSPDAILGSDTVTALASGTVTADDLAPTTSTDVSVPA